MDKEGEDFKFQDEDIEKRITVRSPPRHIELEELRKLEEKEKEKRESVIKSETIKSPAPTTPPSPGKSPEESKSPAIKLDSPIASLMLPQKDKAAKELDKTPDPDKDPYIVRDMIDVWGSCQRRRSRTRRRWWD